MAVGAALSNSAAGKRLLGCSDGGCPVLGASNHDLAILQRYIYPALSDNIEPWCAAHCAGPGPGARRAPAHIYRPRHRVVRVRSRYAAGLRADAHLVVQ